MTVQPLTAVSRVGSIQAQNGFMQDERWATFLGWLIVAECLLAVVACFLVIRRERGPLTARWANLLLPLSAAAVIGLTLVLLLTINGNRDAATVMLTRSAL